LGEADALGGAPERQRGKHYRPHHHSPCFDSKPPVGDGLWQATPIIRTNRRNADSITA
jgi:hypothetical protein